MFQQKSSSKRAEDVKSLSLLDPSLFSHFFPDANDESCVVVRLEKSKSLWVDRVVEFKCVFPPEYPAHPPVVTCLTELNEREYEKLKDEKGDYMIDPESGIVRTLLLRSGDSSGCWSSFFSLQCVVHTLRQIFLHKGFDGCIVCDVGTGADGLGQGNFGLQIAKGGTKESKSNDNTDNSESKHTSPTAWSSQKTNFKNYQLDQLLHEREKVYFKTSSSSYELKGMRSTMEDACVRVDRMMLQGGIPSRKAFYAVFDGHGGSAASRFAGSHMHEHFSEELQKGVSPSRALWNASLSTDLAFWKKIHSPAAILARSENGGRRDNSGTTAICAFFDGEHGLYISNLGDSRAVLCRRGKALSVSSDHKPLPNVRPDECARIVAAGGFIFMGRVLGQLAVCRAIGDVDFKAGASWLESAMAKNTKQFGSGFSKFQNSENAENKNKKKRGAIVTAEPEIAYVDLQHGDEFLLLACDGLFDVLSSQAAIDEVRKSLSQHNNLDRACKDIVEKAVNELGSTDNVTCVIVQFEELKAGDKHHVYKNESIRRAYSFTSKMKRSTYPKKKDENGSNFEMLHGFFEADSMERKHGDESRRRKSDHLYRLTSSSSRSPSTESITSVDIEKVLGALDLQPTRSSNRRIRPDPRKHDEDITSTNKESCRKLRATRKLDNNRNSSLGDHFTTHPKGMKKREWKSYKMEKDELIDFVMSDEREKDNRNPPPLPTSSGSDHAVVDRNMDYSEKTSRRRQVQGIEDDLLDFLYDDKNF
eukprot:g440.t1